MSPLRGNEANAQVFHILRPLDESEMQFFAKVDIESALEHEFKSSTSHSGGGGAAAAVPAAAVAQSDFEAELEAAFS